MNYVIQLQPLPTELVWLDASPIITLSRLVTNSQHITNTGLVLTAFFGLAACIFLFSLFSKKTKS
jgi:hypothetical protein